MLDQRDGDPGARLAAEFFASLVDLGLMIDADDVIAGASPSVARVLGWTVEQIVGRDYLALVHPDHLDDARAAMAAARAGGTVERRMRRLRTAEGGWRDVEISYAHAAEGRLCFLCRDLTGVARDAERAARVEAVSGVGGWEFEAASGRLWWSPTLHALCGVAQDARPTVAAGLRQFPAAARATARDAFRRLLADAAPFDLDLPFVAPDGRSRWVRVTGGPDRATGGRFYGTMQDVTEQKRAERRMAEAIRGANAGAWEWNIHTGEVHLSPRWLEMAGWTEQTFGPITIDAMFKLFHPEDAPLVTAALQAHLAGRTDGYACEIRVRRPDGGWAWVETFGRVASFTPAGAPEWAYGANIDIGARKAQEQALAHTKARLEATLAAIPDLLIEVDAEGRYLSVHSGSPDLLVAAPETLLGRLIEDVAPRHVAALTRRAMAEVDATGHCPGVEYAIDLTVGRRWFEMTAAPTAAASAGGRAGYLFMVRDITRRVEADAAARYRDALLRGLFDMSPLGIVLTDAETGRYVEVNAALLEATGFTRDEQLALCVQDLLPPEHLAGEALAMAQIEAEGRFGPIAREIRRKDGGRFPALVRGVAVQDGAGRRMLWRLVEDISARTKLEQELEAERAFLRALIETSVTAILAYDADGVILHVNAEAERMIGLSASEIVGRPSSDAGFRAFHMDGAPVPVEALPSQRALATGQPQRDMRLIIEYWDGRRLATLASAYPISAPGSAARVVLSVLDVSREVAREAALQVANAALEAQNDLLEARVRERTDQLETALAAQTEINVLQRRVISVISHEFRTPLAIIDASARRVRRVLERAEAERAPDFLRKIHLSVARLTDLLEGVLESARLQEGKVAFSPQPMALADAVREAVEMQAEMAEHMTLALTLDGEGLIEGDPRLVYQIVTNMLSNAVKYSGDATSVEIALAEHADAVRLTVRDHGVGVPASELANVFRSFFRASNTVGVVGTGLGLHLSRALAQMHGGDLTFDSVEGEGSTVTLTLPRRTAPPV